MAREFWTADCETDPFKHGRMPEPFIFGAYNGDEYVEFASADAFVEYFYNKNVIIYAHNGGKFDWHFILDHLEPGVSISVINGRLAKFRIGAAEFRDSYSLLPIPLAAWAKDEFDYGLLEPELRRIPANHDKIRKYLRSDCVNLWDILAKFFDGYGRKFTLAGASMSKWREMSGEEPDQSSRKFYEEMKPYYYGGRVECFQTGNKREKFSVYDINSAYPFAMVHNHPWGVLYFVDNRLPKGAEKIQRSFIKCRARSTGAFPFRSHAGLEFPNDGEFRTFYITGWEWLSALDTGTLSGDTSIIEVREFADDIDFAEYVRHFFDLKASAKERMKNPADRDAKADYIFAKLFMNSLYGKFASNPQEYKEYLTCLPDEPQAMHEIHRCKECEECNEKVLRPFSCERSYRPVTPLHNVTIISRPLPEPSQRYFNVAVGASITGFVRAHLWRAICASDRPLYVDTDSLAARSSRVKIGSELGLWSREGDFKEYAIAGKKLYAFWPVGKDKPKIASKGVKISAEEIRDIARGAEITYKQEAPTFGLRGKKFNVRKITATAKGGKWPKAKRKPRKPARST